MSTDAPQPPEGLPPTPEPTAPDLATPEVTTPEVTTPPAAPPVAPPPVAPPPVAPPPAAPPAYPAAPAAAYPAPPANSFQPAPQNGLGTAALILGILGFVCLGTIGSILAIIFGVMGMKKAEAGLATNGGMAKVGMWLGIVGVVLSIIVLIILGVAIATGGGEWSFNVGTN